MTNIGRIFRLPHRSQQFECINDFNHRGTEPHVTGVSLDGKQIVTIPKIDAAWIYRSENWTRDRLIREAKKECFSVKDVNFNVKISNPWMSAFIGDSGKCFIVEQNGMTKWCDYETTAKLLNLY